jgi:hypothetical protein
MNKSTPFWFTVLTFCVSIGCMGWTGFFNNDKTLKDDIKKQEIINREQDIKISNLEEAKKEDRTKLESIDKKTTDILIILQNKQDRPK